MSKKMTDCSMSCLITISCLHALGMISLKVLYPKNQTINPVSDKLGGHAVQNRRFLILLLVLIEDIKNIKLGTHLITLHELPHILIIFPLN